MGFEGGGNTPEKEPAIQEAVDFLMTRCKARPDIKGDIYGVILEKLEKGEIGPEEAKIKGACEYVGGKIQDIFNGIGNNDREHELKTLRDQIRSGEISPEDGMAIAFGTRQSKGDWEGGH